ncbi:MAG TPA: chemotaxis protein CheB [Abditibacteriaceae bacterium]|jgi:two-component system chemotaxis response regulator CheB
MSIRVLLVEPSPLALAHLIKMIAGNPDIEIVAHARHGREALTLLEEAHPDVICVATAMSLVDGLELTRTIMSTQPRPILVMRDSGRDDAAEGAAMLEAGAVDCFVKPRAAPAPHDALTQELLAKLRRLSRVPVISRSRKDQGAAEVRSNSGPSPAVAAPAETEARAATGGEASGAFSLVAIGASTGGPQGLLAILTALPATFPAPVLCVQHIGKGFLGELVEWLDGQARIRVKIARSGELALAGTAYFPAEDHHLEIDSRGRLHLSPAPPAEGHRPSVSVLFKSVASTHSSRVIAVLLSGMGADGASGLKKVADSGGTTFAQNEATCAVFGMPKQAIELGAAQWILPPDEIASKIVSMVSRAAK